MPGLPAGSIWYNEALFKAIVVLVALPLCSLRTMSSLRFTSLFAITCTVFLVAVCVAQYFVFATKGWAPAFWAPNGTISTGDIASSKPDSIAKAFSIIIYSYTCHPNVLPIYLELQRRSPRRMNKVCRRSLGTAFSLYLFMGLFGFLTFGQATSSNILLNDYRRDVSVIVAAFVVCISITLTIPLFIHAWRKSFIELVFGEVAMRASPLKHFGVTLLVVGAALALGVLVTDLSVPFGLLGASINPIICYILPAVFFVRIQPDGSTACQRRFAVAMACFMTATAVYSLYSQISAIIYPTYTSTT